MRGIACVNWNRRGKTRRTVVTRRGRLLRRTGTRRSMWGRPPRLLILLSPPRRVDLLRLLRLLCPSHLLRLSRPLHNRLCLLRPWRLSCPPSLSLPASLSLPPSLSLLLHLLHLLSSLAPPLVAPLVPHPFPLPILRPLACLLILLPPLPPRPIVSRRARRTRPRRPQPRRPFSRGKRTRPYWSPFECDRSRFKVVVRGGSLCVSLRESDGVDWPVRLVCCVEYRE